MTTARTFFNIKYARNTGSHLSMIDLARKTQPNYALVMNSNEDAFAIQAASPRTVVINRSWREANGAQWKRRNRDGSINHWYKDPLAYADELMGQPIEHMVYLLNEPTAERGNEHSIRDLVGWLIRCAKRLIDHGYTVCMFNASVGSYGYDDVFAGFYDDLLIFLDQNKGKAVLGLHEYGPFYMPFGQAGIVGDLLTEPRYWHEAGNTYRDIDHELFRDTWHVGRCHWFVHRARHLGLSDPDIVLTEAGIDRLPDVNHLFGLMQSKFGTAKHPHHEGIQFQQLQGFYTMHHIYRQMFPDISTSQVIYNQMNWAEAFYPEWVKGILYFMVGQENPGNLGKEFAKWDLEGGFNPGADGVLMQKIFDAAIVQPLPEPPVIDRPDEDDMEWIKAVIYAVDATAGDKAITNIRNGAGTSNPVIARLTAEATPAFIDEATKDDLWVHIQADIDGVFIDGWIHSGWFGKGDGGSDLPEPPSTDEPTTPVDVEDLPRWTIMMNEDERNHLAYDIEELSHQRNLTERERAHRVTLSRYISKSDVKEDEG